MIQTKTTVKARKKKKQDLAVDIPENMKPDIDCDVCDRKKYCISALSGSYCSQFIRTPEPEPEQNNGKKKWKIIKEAEG